MHPCGQLKFLMYIKYCWQALGQNVQSCKVTVNIYLYFHLLISVCPKTIYIYGEEIYENTIPPYELISEIIIQPDKAGHFSFYQNLFLKIYIFKSSLLDECMTTGKLFTSCITPRTTLGNNWVMPKTLAWSLQHWRVVRSLYPWAKWSEREFYY